ncbi:hypothetical protein [Ottowia caeni]|uniref:hypothetical protein n=1 Tax=Ottowia caeni TaxID=2870339 RepID=UPI003D70E993
MSPVNRARAQRPGRSAHSRPKLAQGAASLVVAEGSRSRRTPPPPERVARPWLAHNLPRALMNRFGLGSPAGAGPGRSASWRFSPRNALPLVDLGACGAAGQALRAQRGTLQAAGPRPVAFTPGGQPSGWGMCRRHFPQ